MADPPSPPPFATQGQNEGPGFPRPLVSELDIHLPLLNMDNAQGQLEEACVPPLV